VPRFPVDPSVTNPKHCVVPVPDGHPRRCQGRARHRGGEDQCQLWALKGREYCQYHGGRIPLGRVGTMRNFYSKYAGPTLKARLEELAQNDDVMDLSGEIDVSRGMAAEALVYLEAIAQDTEGKVSAETRALALSTARTALSHVAHLVEKMAKVTSVKAQGGFTAQQIPWLAYQITLILQKEVNDEAVVKRVVDSLDQLKLPADSKVNPRIKLLSLDGDVIDAESKQDQSVGERSDGGHSSGDTTS
jgi:hypothetical protein